METLKDGWAGISSDYEKCVSQRMETLDLVIAQLTQFRNELASVAPTDYSGARVSDYVDRTQTAVKSIGSAVVDRHKDVVKQVRRLQKIVDDTFALDSSVPEPPALKSDVLHMYIADHMLREGYFSAADSFSREAGCAPSSTLAHELQTYKTIHHGVSEILAGRLDIPIAWCMSHEQELNASGSSLLFHLHKLRYLQLVESGDALNAAAYARTHFLPFFSPRAQQQHGAPHQKPQHHQHIQRLLGALVYAHDVHHSPYASLFHPARLQTAAEEFKRECFRIAKLTMEGPLFVALSAGLLGLPVIARLTSVLERAKTVVLENAGQQQTVQGAASTIRAMPYGHHYGRDPNNNSSGGGLSAALGASKTDPNSANSKHGVWAAADLPDEVPLPLDYQFHTLFVCPVSKELASPENPPLALQCGHVICRRTAERLLRGTSTRFKCPICPTESLLQYCTEVHF
jgi:hypothetical protein